MKSIKLKRSKPTAKPRASMRRQVSDSSARPAAFSYYSRRADQEATTGRQQPREQDNRRKQRIAHQLGQRFGLVIVAVVLLVCVIDVLHLSHQPKIVSLATTSAGNNFLQPDTVYEQAAAKLFASSILNGNKATVQTTAIQTDLKKQFPELADVSITLPLVSHRPVVYVAPATPGLILVTTSGRFVIDQSGRVLLAATDNAASLPDVPVVQDQSNLQLSIGSAALPSGTVAFIKMVSSELAAKKVTLQSVTLPAAAYELDIKPQDANYIIKFNLHETGEALQQVGTYLAIKQRLAEQSIVPSQYIDVRVSGRAYYL